MRYKHKFEKEMMCPLEYGLNIFGGKWKSRIICVLSSKEQMRYKELKNELVNISDTVLADMLKELLRDNIVERIQYNEIPIRVEYFLTEKGRSILPILQSICTWSKTNIKNNLEQKLSMCKNCSQI